MDPTIAMVAIYEGIDEVKSLFNSGAKAKARKLLKQIEAKASKLGSKAMDVLQNKLGDVYASGSSDRVNKANKAANEARAKRREEINSLTSDISALQSSAMSNAAAAESDNTWLQKTRKKANKQLKKINKQLDSKQEQLENALKDDIKVSLSK